MENAANGEAAATEPSAQSPDMIDTPKEKAVAEEPALTSEDDDKGESSSSRAESLKEATSAPSETKIAVNEASSLHKRSLSVVLKLPPQELAEKKDNKKRKDGDKRHRKALSSVMPVIPASLDHADGTDRIRLGICAMDKKARSKPMAEILSRLDEKLFRVIFFGDQTILHTPVEEWPFCDVLIAFHSKGYPLVKAKQYVELVDPFILNDLEMQEVIKDRRKIYDMLEASGIDVPRHVFLSRDGYVSTGTGGGNGNNDQEVAEYDDHIEVNGVIIHKPFVEKPVNADDHNIAIYYQSSAGGGCKKLFRKIGNRSSEFYADVNEVRRDGSYIYEQFVETQGTDVKMYTVGPEYGHAEARKSPTVDGKVERDLDGKEVRFPVILTLREKEIARRIVIGFKQYVCGFDLLRVQEGDSLVPYVCDVNGWSFVKNSRKYYDDCAQILTEHMLAALKPMCLRCFSTLDPMLTVNPDLLDEEASMTDTRTPPLTKQLSLRKRTSTIERMARLMQGEPGGDDEEDAGSLTSRHTYTDNDGLEMPTTLVEGAIPVREMPDQLVISEPASMCPSSNSSQVDEQDRQPRRFSLPGSHQEELRCVIAVVRHGDRTPKQKLKLNTKEPLILKYFQKHSENCWEDLKVKAKTPLVQFLKTIKTMISEKELEHLELSAAGQKANKEFLYKLKHMRDILERWKIAGLNRKLQIKPKEWEEYMHEEGETHSRATEVQLILKWGGNLTKLGEKQAINLGQRLRHEMYPDAPGGGILRLHSTFRHDLKIKTSDEGRVMKTAAAFAKGLLELEGEIPPILVSLVHKETDSLHMLDPSGNKEVRKELEGCKEKININLQKDIDFDKTTVKEHEELVGPASLTSLHDALRRVGNPRKTLFTIHRVIGELISQLEDMLGVMASGDESRIEGGEGLRGKDEADTALSGVKLYKGETLLELTERWRLLYSKMYDEEKDVFDLSRVPDIHDNVRFDMLHNPHLGLTSTLEALYEPAKLMADCVVPQEYGTTLAEKRSIGSKMCGALLEKIKFDLLIARTDNMTDMRYMIDMAYSADLPINSMGRRIRTRLYFTSESHLHTMVNVLRFGGCDGQKSILSQRGLRIINQAPELCYLTQIVIRLFEDTRRDMENPRRYRVEILFSPGATATPMHIDELDRDADSTRFDTSGLEFIGKEGLTCKDVEDLFSSAIIAGQIDESEFSLSPNMKESPKKPKSKKTKSKDATQERSQTNENATVPRTVTVTTNKEAVKEKNTEAPKTIEKAPIKWTNTAVVVPKVESMNKRSQAVEPPIPKESIPVTTTKVEAKSEAEKSGGDEKKKVEDAKEELPRKIRALSYVQEEDEDDEDARVERLARSLAQKYFWRSVGILSFVVGVSCLVLSMNVHTGPSSRRRWSRR